VHSATPGGRSSATSPRAMLLAAFQGKEFDWRVEPVAGWASYQSAFERPIG
jgi:hypothetical protein